MVLLSPARLTALLLLVPMAMATCPCPPAPQSSKVCGSNAVTYDSQCALDCAAVQQPGLVTARPGSCSNSFSILNNIFNISLPTVGNPSNKPRSSVRSAADDYLKIITCTQTKCNAGTDPSSCGCSSTDVNCMYKCSMTCACDCDGVSAGTSGWPQVAQCMSDNKCEVSDLTSCLAGCDKDLQCNIKCELDIFNCQCKCNGSLSLRSSLGVTIALLSVWLIRTI